MGRIYRSIPYFSSQRCNTIFIMIYKFLTSTLFALIFSSLAFADGHAPQIKEAVLSSSVVDRQPTGDVVREVTCNDAAKAPTFKSDDLQNLYLWTRVSNDKKRVISHTWERFDGDNWQAIAEVPLRVGVSSGWRTWSSKTIDADFHKGAWRVIVVAEDNPDDALCSIYLNIR